MKQTYTLKLEPSTIEVLKKRAKILGHTHTAYSRHVLETAVDKSITISFTMKFDNMDKAIVWCRLNPIAWQRIDTIDGEITITLINKCEYTPEIKK